MLVLCRANTSDRLRRVCQLWSCVASRNASCDHTNRSCDAINKSYFITTPIYYVNSVPHIGHLYSTFIADALHRFHISLGVKRTIFSTGTDEHGMKVQRAAEASGLPPQAFCDSLSDTFKNLFKLTDITNTHFIRTTHKSHWNAVENIWNNLVKNNYIYKSSYEGWYCVADETFVTESQVVFNDKNIRVSSESDNPVEWSVEENYMFRLSEFSQRLLDWLNSGDIVKPAVFSDILKRDIKSGLRDISVSRPKSRLYWGIPVPGDESQTIYVWLDALINYLTASGYPNYGSIEWPADCQVIGKDILKFHGIFWPAFLMGAGLQPPRSLLCHSHWTVDDRKMSKSKGNVIDPFEKLQTYTVDGLRYFLLREGSPQTDCNYNEEKLINYLNAELADTLGNLLSRCTSKSINKSQVFPIYSSVDLKLSEAHELIATTKELADKCKEHYSDGNFYLGIIAIMDCLRLANLFFHNAEPWTLAKQSNSEANLFQIIFITLEVLRVCGILLNPIVPNISKQILDKLNVELTDRKWINAEQAFNYTNNTELNLFKNLNQSTSLLYAKIKS